MERIKQALELARQQRESLGQTERRREPPAGAAAPLRAERPQPPPDEPEDASIRYVHTRVQPVSPELLERNRVLNGAAQDDATTAYKLLRTQVLQRMAARDWNALAVTSAGPGEGKTLTAVNLAISLAHEVHYTVLLVDLDLRRPAVHKCLGLEPEYGLGDFLLHKQPLHEILINPGIERLVVLPSKTPVHNSSEMLASPRMAALVRELKTRYPRRFVLFDLPPLLAADDALAFSPHVDAALLVIEDGATRKPELQQALQLLQGTHLLGTVLNRSQERLSQYPY